MPFNPAVNYRGDQYVFQGLQNAGNILSEDLQKTIAKIDDNRKQLAFSDTVIARLAQTKGPDGHPYIDPETLSKYQSGSLSAKQGIVQGAMANLHSDMESAKTNAEVQLSGAHTAYFNAAAQGKLDAGQTPTVIDPVMDPSSGEPVPGMGVVRKTGATINTSATGAPPQLDATGKFYYDNKTRGWKPLPAATMVLPGMNQGGAAPAAGGPAEVQQPNGGAPAQSQQPGKVHVIGTDGKGGWIPAERLQDYITAGYRQG